MTKSKSQRTTPGQRLLLVLFGVAVVGLLVALTEGALALLGLGDPEMDDDPMVGFEASPSLFEHRSSSSGEDLYVTRPEKLLFFNKQSFAAEKAPGTLRIFTLGGSTTAGRPYDDHVSFSRWLERFLDVAEPGRRHEVINAGAISYASYRVARLMSELVDYEPDVLIVLTGHNEFLEERSYRELRESSTWRRHLRGGLSRLRLSRLAWKAWEKPPAKETILPAEVKTRLDVWTGLEAYERDEELRRQVEAHFANNLRRMARSAEERGIALIFVPPASNLKDFSPFKSEHRGDLGAAERASFDRLLVAGRESLKNGDPAAAQRHLTEALEIDGLYAMAWFQLGKAYLAASDFAASEDAFRRAKELDIAPLRALDAFVRQIPDIAEESAASWLDWPSLLQQTNQDQLGHGILGNELFLDHVHPTIEAHVALARALVDHLAEGSWIEPGDDFDSAAGEGKLQEIQAEILADLDAAYYARRDVNLAKVLGWSGKLAEAEAPLLRARPLMQGDVDFHLALGTLWQKMGRDGEALGELEEARRLAPESSEAQFNLAVVYGRLGRRGEAIDLLRDLVERFPGYGEAWQNLGLLQRLEGGGEAALPALLEARELAPGRSEIHRSLALAHRDLGRFEEAISAHREALAIAESALDRRELAITLAMAERRGEASREIERALEIDPLDAENHYSQARILAESGSPADAVAAYQRTLELAPEHARGHNNLGILLASAGELEAAHGHLLRAIDLDPSFAEAFLNLGVVFDRAGQPAQAITSIGRSLELNPDQPRAHLALGLLLRATGRDAEARPHLDAAREAGLATPTY